MYKYMYHMCHLYIYVSHMYKYFFFYINSLRLRDFYSRKTNPHEMDTPLRIERRV